MQLSTKRGHDARGAPCTVARSRRPQVTPVMKAARRLRV